MSAGGSVVKAGVGFGTALAITISWTANKSLLWVVVHGILGWIYVVYYALVHHFGRAMRDRGRGGIVMLGSRASSVGSMKHSVYGGVKAFGQIFAESLWIELRDSGVDVLQLVLGLTRTPAMERVGINFEVPGMPAADPEDVAREGLARLAEGPVWRAGEDNARSRADAVLGMHRVMEQLMKGTR